MKKRFLLTLGLLSIFSLISCQNTSSEVSEIITGIEILGPTTVNVGEKITLIVDVLGSEKDDVIWSSENNEIATVDENGIVTGVSNGEVIITATSKDDANFSSRYKINVISPKLTSFNVIIEDSQYVSYNQDSNIYDVALGQTFYVSLDIDKSKVKEPDSISYEIVFPSGTESSSVVTVEKVVDDATRAKVKTYQALKGVAIKVSCAYADGATGNIINSVYFDVIDTNIENLAKANSIINSLKESENNNLRSGKITKKRIETINESDESKSSINTNETIEFSNYNNNSYSKITKSISNGNSNITTNTTLYSGIDNSFNKYYLFEYNQDGIVTNLYENTSKDKYIDTSSLYCDVDGATTYGLANLVSSFINSTSKIRNDLISFGDIYCYANASFDFTNNKFKISSDYTDEDTDVSYNISLEVEYDDDNKLISYTLKQEIISSTSSITYEEVCSSLAYGSLSNDSITNPIFLDINDYYIEDFLISNFNGKLINPETNQPVYDYSSLDKYGVDFIDEVDGITRYTLTYDKTLIIKITPSQPATASLEIDRISVKSSDENQIPTVQLTGSDIVAISPKKDDNSLAQPGQAAFTFTSTKGIQKKIIVQFIEAELEGMLVTMIDNYSLGTIFESELTPYFYLNSIPDEDKYTFKIKITEGNENGIELYQWEKGNLFGYPHFSFSIKGIKAGQYKFRFYIDGYDYVQSEEYSITVEEPYQVDYIKQQLLGQSYLYDTGTLQFTILFKTENTFDITYSNYGTPITKECAYRIEKGRIIIDNEISLGSDFYFGFIKEGDIVFAKDFSTIQLFVSIYNRDYPDQKSYFPQVFNKIN